MCENMGSCFSGPLALICSEKSQSRSSSLALFGVNEFRSTAAQRRLELLREDIKTKRSNLAARYKDEERYRKNASKCGDASKQVGALRAMAIVFFDLSLTVHRSEGEGTERRECRPSRH